MQTHRPGARHRHPAAKYSESHRNPTNELIHFVCVPVIVFSLLGIMWAVHPLAAVRGRRGALVYYFQLSKPFAIGMLVMSAADARRCWRCCRRPTVLPLSIAIFVLAWVGQFIGHQIEGKKPSFLDDLRFLLIGPLFVLSFLYRRLNARLLHCTHCGWRPCCSARRQRIAQRDFIMAQLNRQPGRQLGYGVCQQVYV